MKHKTTKLLTMTLCLLITFTLIPAYSTSTPQQATKGAPAITQASSDDPINVTFRLLAIEGYYSNSSMESGTLVGGDVDQPMKSAEYLITALQGYNNWQNNSQTYKGFKYTTHIHLLSANPDATSLPYYRGTPTNSNVLNEIQTFLAATQSWENNSLTIRILYYVGHSGYVGQGPKPQNSKGGFFLALGERGSDPANYPADPSNPSPYQELWDYQLDQALNHGDLANNNCTLIILDSCHSGAAIAQLTRKGRVIMAACSSNQLALGWLSAPKQNTADHWSWFTGQDSANSYFSNGTQTPWKGGIGIIGAMKNASDPNSDGWGTSNEIFYDIYGWYPSTANLTTYEYSYTETQVIGSIQGNAEVPQIKEGVSGCYIPLVQYNTSSTFPYNGIAYLLHFIVPNNSWGSFHCDSGRVGLTQSDGPMLNNVLWSHLNYDTNASVIVGNWEAIVATKGVVGGFGVVHGLDLVTGNEVWNYTAESQIIATPAVVNNIIYIATFGGGGGGGGAGGWLRAINEPTGRVLWQWQAPLGVGFYASPAVADGRVYVATYSETSTTYGIYAFNQTTGRLLWARTLDSPIKSSPTVKDGRVYVATTARGSTPARLHALAESTGTKLWNYSFGLSNVISTPAVAAGLVLIGCMGGGGGGGGGAGLYAFRESGSTPIWEYLTPTPVSSSPAVDEKKGIVVGASEAPGGGGGGGSVFALTLTGSLIWASPPESVKMSSPAISGNSLVYVGTADGKLLCLNETSGVIVWSYTTAGPVTSSPAISENHVLVGTTGSTLYSFGSAYPDVAVMSVTPCKTCLVEGDILNINVTVSNKGDLAQTFNITLYAGTYWAGRAIETLQVTLAGKSSTTLTFSLGFSMGFYVFGAYAWPVKYEINTIDNYCFNNGIALVAPIARFRPWSWTRPIRI